MSRYWLWVGLGCLLFGVGLGMNKQRFNEEEMMMMIETPTKLKGLTEDYCKYHNALDPIEPNKLAVKIIFWCGERKTMNIISWETLADKTVEGLVEQVARINGLVKKEVNCQVDGQKVSNNFILSPGNLVACET